MSLFVCGQALFCACMKKTYNTVQKRSFRRWIKQVFARVTLRRDFDYEANIAKVIEMLREVEESIDIIAREISRQAKRGK